MRADAPSSSVRKAVKRTSEGACLFSLTPRSLSQFAQNIAKNNEFKQDSQIDEELAAELSSSVEPLAPRPVANW